jgi:hypothetical protein
MFYIFEVAKTIHCKKSSFFSFRIMTLLVFKLCRSYLAPLCHMDLSMFYSRRDLTIHRKSLYGNRKTLFRIYSRALKWNQEVLLRKKWCSEREAIIKKNQLFSMYGIFQSDISSNQLYTDKISFQKIILLNDVNGIFC